jgi:hypothetical protein
MNFINVKPELLDATYWMLAHSTKYELVNPTSSQGGMDLFVLKSTKFITVKQVLSATKPIMIHKEKVSLIETDFKAFEIGSAISPFRSSKLFAEQGEKTQASLIKYMQRIVGAFATIENTTLAASQTSGEGTDTSALSSEEREARRRLDKANMRLKTCFAGISEMKELEFTPAYLTHDIPEEIANYIENNTYTF